MLVTLVLCRMFIRAIVTKEVPNLFCMIVSGERKGGAYLIDVSVRQAITSVG